MNPELAKSLEGELSECRCGHDKAEHAGGCGACGFVKTDGSYWYDGDGKRGYDCWCKAFDDEPWPWTISAVYSPPYTETIDAEGKTWYGIGDKAADHYTVQKQNHDKTYGPYKTEARAVRQRDELNREMVQGPLDPVFIGRRERLKRLAPHFGYLYSGPPGARWPVKPERYLVSGMGRGWHPEEFDELAADFDAVRAIIADDENDVFRVIDLDTGDQVPWDRQVSVQIGHYED